MYGRMYVCVYVCMYLCMHLSLCQKLRLLRTGGYGILQTRPYAHTHVLANTHTSVSDSARTYALTDALSPAAHPPLSTLPDLYHTHPHTPAPVGASSPYTLAHTHTQVAAKGIIIRLLALCPGFAHPHLQPSRKTGDDLEFSFGASYAATFLIT
jgi:hypothetical protein